MHSEYLTSLVRLVAFDLSQPLSMAWLCFTSLDGLIVLDLSRCTLLIRLLYLTCLDGLVVLNVSRCTLPMHLLYLTSFNGCVVVDVLAVNLSKVDLKHLYISLCNINLPYCC